MANPHTPRQALISVSDKTQLIPFAAGLHAQNIILIATGNTAKLLRTHDIPVTEVSDYTGFPEILNGRVKTLHPRIHAGLLARRGLDDDCLTEQDILPIDIVVANLYPFEDTIAKPDTSLSDAIEQIDIGGPTLLRAAAKNHEYVTVVTDPADYETVLTELQTHGNTALSTRRYLAYKVFTQTAAYDIAIQTYFAKQLAQEGNPNAPTELPATFLQSHILSQPLRYGENPQQHAAFYSDTPPVPNSLVTATRLQGKPLSYNNMVDADAALHCAKGLDPETPGCVIIKHATPCGAAQAKTLLDAYEKAYRCDAQSAFGGIIAVNQTLDAKTAEHILKQQFVEVIIAPHITEDAASVLTAKPQCRVLCCGPLTQTMSHTIRSISGGLLVQTPDTLQITPDDWAVVSKKTPSPEDLCNLIFAWRVVRFVKSNAIVYAKDNATLGIGTGQTSRVFSVQIAALKANEANLSLESAVMASDAFFPFADGVRLAAKTGITAIIQPGGSKRDAEVIAAADDCNIAMIMTGQRHFLH